jgi:hypothetical protein
MPCQPSLPMALCNSAALFSIKKNSAAHLTAPPLNYTARLTVSPGAGTHSDPTGKIWHRFTSAGTKEGAGRTRIPTDPATAMRIEEHATDAAGPPRTAVSGASIHRRGDTVLPSRAHTDAIILHQ